MKRLYEAGAYSDASVQESYWRTTATSAPYPPAQGETGCDFAIVGAGYTGLSAALHLARDHGADVTVLEAEEPGWGASGRNGGFACLGGAKASDAALARRFGAQDLALFHAAQTGAIDSVAEILDRYGIDADRHSEGETILAHRPRDMRALRAEAPHVQASYGVTPRLIPREELADRGMAGPAFHGGMTVPIGFALNPMKYAQGLARAAVTEGARIHARSPVTGIERQAGGGYVLNTPRGRLRARKLLLATNGYSSDDLPPWLSGRYLPLQSSVLVTRELTGAELRDQGWTTDQMAYDTRNLLHYFRLMPNRRFLFGMRGGVRSSPAALEWMKTEIRRDFERMFPAWAHVETPHFWAGLVCMARDLAPYVGPLGDWPDAFTALAYHGNGVAMATYSGALMADLAAGRAPGRAFPALMRAPLRRFPLGPLRRALLHPAYYWYALRDL
ncbi:MULTISPECIES: NAD(P)/FAD-dependent oxidoreductase [Actibacterium]|uniref:Glycine/D-amino acid oxidase-like deaminating enzyme n=1 Tax=Actibacterium naphthalenivorans TaxID=1614693 RepID=A0A840CAI9_9RHOB|nr:MULTISPECIES: FAD-binding oxidoreductase [Actibacterium]ALG90774.1 FAD-dependent oxidoreductase [Actibacterium sp. EMB200-NS6]MBB4023011.1 glycine/D-amino acid oxidase-like deaminating enzyme [Actibacterium naphthalenivorans]